MVYVPPQQVFSWVSKLGFRDLSAYELADLEV